MKISEQWLRSLINPGVDTATLAHRLTMAGLKIDAVLPAGAPLDGVVAGRVTAVERHPEADKLTVCTVDDGTDTRTIVCGADNVRVDMVAPLAKPGAVLPGVDGTIGEAELRGVRSQGMLCSGRELGLSDDHSGLFELPTDLAPGTALARLLGYGDHIMEVDLTPNRGDCLSVRGVAREVAVIFGLEASAPDAAPVAAVTEARFPVKIENSEDCTCYAGRLIHGVNTQRPSPLWMQERLRRSGIRPLGAAVDVTAYVMLELGQPMHAFDLARLTDGIVVRRGRAGESLALLDGQKVTVDGDVLVIADGTGPVALAGIMGGAESAVGEGTTDVFLESAHFAPLSVVGRGRRYGLHTEASQRFERGVDPSLAVIALERATALLLEIAGGEAGPVVVAGVPAPTVRDNAIPLRRERITTLLGITLDDAFVEDTLMKLGMDVAPAAQGWTVRAPSWRYDLEIEADLIEELARLYGYDHIPSRDFPAPMILHPVPDAQVPVLRLEESLIQRGYQQVITYSFVDPALQALLRLNDGALDLANPISSELAQMRTSLWPGLIAVLTHNVKRQQSRVRLFESGLRFISQGNVLKQERMLAGLAFGDRNPVQWGEAARPVDFYDVKADLEALIALGGARRASFEAVSDHPTLHPGQAARVVLEGEFIGLIGALHPRFLKELDLPKAPILFELALPPLTNGEVPAAHPVSRFPALRRDLALVVPEAVRAADLLGAVDEGAPEWLAERFIFDIYRGKGVEPGLKSIALGLILQDSSRTLTDDEVDRFVHGLIQHLGKSVQATLRD